MDNLTILALDNERVKKLKWYNLNKKNITESFFAYNTENEVTVIFSKNNFSHIGNIIKNKNIKYICLTEKFKEKFTKFTVPYNVVLIDGKNFFVKLIPEIIKKLKKCAGEDFTSSIAIDCQNYSMAENLFRSLNQYFREVVFITNDSSLSIIKEAETEYGIPVSVKKTDKKIFCPVIIKTGKDEIICSEKSVMFDLFGNTKNSVTSADISFVKPFPYNVNGIAMCEALSLLGITPQYKINFLKKHNTHLALSQLLKKH